MFCNWFIVILNIIQYSSVDFKKLLYLLLITGYIVLDVDAKINVYTSEQFRSLLILVSVGFLLFVFFIILDKTRQTDENSHRVS